jgi:hypothetical protein
MKLTRPRLTVGLLMLVVAGFALMIAGRGMWQQRSRSLRLAAEAGGRERNFKARSLEIAGDPSMAGSDTALALMPDGNEVVEFRNVGGTRRVFYPRGSPRPADAETVERLARWCREVSDRYGELRRKHERSARYPWLSVEPDPPRKQLTANPEL